MVRGPGNPHTWPVGRLSLLLAVELQAGRGWAGCLLPIRPPEAQASAALSCQPVPGPAQADAKSLRNPVFNFVLWETVGGFGDKAELISWGFGCSTPNSWAGRPVAAQGAESAGQGLGAPSLHPHLQCSRSGGSQGDKREGHQSEHDMHGGQTPRPAKALGAVGPCTAGAWGATLHGGGGVLMLSCPGVFPWGYGISPCLHWMLCPT